MNLEQQVERGAQADALLRSTIYQEGWTNVRQAIHEQWESCPLRDREGAHELRLMLKLLNDVQAVFESVVADGKVAAHELKRLNEKVISPKEFFGR